MMNYMIHFAYITPCECFGVENSVEIVLECYCYNSIFIVMAKTFPLCNVRVFKKNVEFRIIWNFCLIA